MQTASLESIAGNLPTYTHTSGLLGSIPGLGFRV